MASKLPEYGSLKTSSAQADEDVQKDGDVWFDADNAYYLKDGKTNLTAAERGKKLLLICVPIFTALLIVGGAALFLLRDFGNLYPGPSGSSTSKHANNVQTPSQPDSSTSRASSEPRGSRLPTAYNSSPTNTRTPPSSTPVGKKTKSSESSCLLHTACSPLIGECCPTQDGIFLSCCN